MTFRECCHQKMNLMLTALSALICLMPLIDMRDSAGIVDDDGLHLLSDTHWLIHRSPTLLASFFVILIPAADLLLDLPAHISSKLSRKSTESVVVRLNDLERLIFIIGVGIQSSIWFISISSRTEVSQMNVIYSSTTNSSAALVLGPILTYLQRCTTTFTSLRITIILVFSAFGLLVGTASYFYRYEPDLQLTLRNSGLCILVLPTAIFVSLTSICAFKYCKVQLQYLSESPGRLNFFTNPFRRCVQVNKKVTLIDNDKELYSNYIPALHMASCLAIMIAITYVNVSTVKHRIQIYEVKNYIVITAEVIVLVIELRIRKNEIARGLIALLESKKSYVRHISHELRTPLNTAFLGLKLLSNEMKTSTDPKDAERYDTLCDVNMSCTAAVDILNDLLCYEKLESGILELHKEKIIVKSFLTESLAMFSLQARECGVTMQIKSDFDSDPSLVVSRTSPSLLSDDIIFADKFKMDQVIRNLISNALKFTPRGGAVTITASFKVNSNEEPCDRTVVKRGRGSVADVTKDIAQPNTSTRGILHQRNSRKVSHFDLSSVSNIESSSVFGKLVLVVTDTGAGISDKNQLRLFNEIVQFSPEKLQAGGGSGLGLWITGGIMRLHDGGIRVYSEGEGKGSSFTVEMPMQRRPEVHLELLSPSIPCLEEISFCSDIRRPSFDVSSSCCKAETDDFYDQDGTTDHGQDSQQQPPTVSTVEASKAVSRKLPPFHVLVVDDSRLNRKMLLKCLRADGHECDEGSDGLEAIAMVKKKIDYANGGTGLPYDAILMDFIMPNVDGPTATKAIRALGYTAPIFGVTGNGLPSDVEYFLSCGADRVLLKPLDINTFAPAMREMVE